MLFEIYYLFNWIVMVSYMFRHYVFSFAAIKHRSKEPSIKIKISWGEPPFVSIFVPVARVANMRKTFDRNEKNENS